MRRGFWILTLALLLAAASHAQTFRQLPANGKLGETGAQQPFPLVQIGDSILRLAPGGRIYDAHNRIILHGALPPEAAVLFAQDMNGDISRIYILRIDELEQIKQRLQQQK